jgi:hypothetical protein
MTTTVAFANTNDAYLFSGSSSYSSALSGPADGVSAVDDASLFIGQQLSGSTFTIYQAFVQFGYTAAADQMPTSAYFRLNSHSVTGTSVARGLEVQTFDWDGTVDVNDWRTPAQLALGNNNRVANLIDIQNASNLTMRAGIPDLDEVDDDATLRYVINSTNNRQQEAPSSLEYNGIRSADYSGTSADPALYVASVTDSLLNRSLGAQVQLSDGTHVYIEFSSVVDGEDDNSLIHQDNDGNTTNLGTFTGQTFTRRGAQNYSLARDADDNLYVINQRDADNSLNCRAFIKGSGYSWSTGTLRGLTLPTYESDVNNTALTWHPQGGSFGTLVALIGHRAAGNRNRENQMLYALLNCDHLINGSGSLARRVASADGLLVAGTSINGFNNFPNETGTLLDVSSAQEGSARGYVMSTARHHVLSANSGQSVARYTLNGSGTGFSEVWNFHDNFSGFSTKDANAKSRLLPVSESRYATVNASSSTEFGLVVKHRQQLGNEFTVLADVRLDEQDLTSMPSASTLSTANNWDAIYNPLDNRVWVYYFDTNDGQRLMRTHVDLSTGQAGQDEVEVNDSVGATGSTNHAIRVHRHHTIGEQMLITVANETSGGTHSLIYVDDLINVAPDQPVLIPKENFDSDEEATFEWTFIDPNESDTQSAFQLQIDNATTEASAFDTGKTASTDSNYTLAASSIDNEEDYRWRIRVWDSSDEVSEWSDYGFFTTSASGVVNITDPDSDNDPDIVTANYLVQWEVSGTTQEDYRVVVFRTDTDEELVDTGWVESDDTEYLVEGMLADVEWQVEVTVRDSADIESNTATRLITPDYNSPEVPIISFNVENDGGYIGLSIENPEPVGDRPNPDTNVIHRREVSTSATPDAFQVLGEVEENGSFRDYTAASGVEYEYRVRAVAGEFFTDSTITEVDDTLEIEGVWIHNPADAQTTVRQFRFGKDNRSTSIDIMGTVQTFAGRKFPVVDFGEHEEEDFSISVDIPHGPDYRTQEADLKDFAESKITLVLRDNRGRSAYGTLTGFNQSDQAWGISVAFKFSRVSFDIEEV